MGNIALAEFDVGTDWTRYTGGTWFNYSAGIFYTDFTGTYSSISSDWTGDVETLTVSTVGSVFAFLGSVTYNLTSVASIVALDDDPSFYWDTTNDLLYIRLPNFDPPDLYEIVLGVSARVAGRHWIDEDGGQQYDGNLKNLPTISKSIDPLFFGRVSQSKAVLGLENTHGEYDDFPSYDVYGQQVRIYYGEFEDSYSDLTQAWDGYIDDFDIGEDKIDISSSDARGKLETPIPNNTFDTTTYSDLDDNDENKPIPLGYGTIRGAVPICVNKSTYTKDTAGDFTFKIVDMADHDAIYSIDDVYYNGESLTGSANTDDLYWKTASDSLTDATFVISKLANIELDASKVTVDFKGFEDSGGSLISNGLDVIRDLVEIYAGTAYSNANYDTDTWAGAATNDKAIGYYIDKEITVLKAIETITGSIQIQFDVMGDGRYTARVYDADKAISKIIQEDEILGDITLNYDSTEFLSRCSVNYAGGKTYLYTTDEEEINKRFKYKRPRTFDTLLTSEADAKSFSERIMEFSGEVKPLINVTTKMQNADLNIEDVVLVYVNRRAKDWLGLIQARVEGVDLDLNNFEVTLALRKIGEVPDDIDYLATETGETLITESGDALIDYVIV